MDQLVDTLRETMLGYTGKGMNGYNYLTTNPDEKLFAVISIAKIRDKRFADSSLIARVEADHIIIERDMNDKILLDALLAAGVPRDQIILAYAGEPVPETV